MGCFADHHDQFRLPIHSTDGKGPRRAQLGATHAVASHFTLRHDPAVITMPTGAGKTVVISLSAYLLWTSRVLVVTPGRLVWSQIAQEFRTLGTLKDIGVLWTDCASPAMQEARGHISGLDRWKQLASNDVVVGTPFSMSPAMKDIPALPPEFFDLLHFYLGHVLQSTTTTIPFSSPDFGPSRRGRRLERDRSHLAQQNGRPRW